MIEKYLQIEARSLVLIGNFNPLIFQPSWLSLKNLIQEEEAESANIEVIHPEITKFDIGDWLKVEITVNRCSFSTAKEPYFDPMKDLVLSIFQILREIPMSAFGINNTFNLTLQNINNYFKFGKALTPLDIWDENVKEPRLLRLDITEDQRSDSLKRNITIRPSNQKLGVSVNINNDYEIKNAASIVDILNKNWDKESSNSRQIVDNLLKKIYY